MSNKSNLKKTFNNEQLKKMSYSDTRFFEVLNESQDYNDFIGLKQKSTSSNELYKIQEFLESDHIRLQNIDKLYSKKLFILGHFSQGENIQSQQDMDIEDIKNKITNRLKLNDSSFLNEIGLLWNDSFNN